MQQLKELSLAPKVVEQMELQLSKQESINDFSMAQRVTYNYFAGKLKLFYHEFAEVGLCLFHVML